MGLGRRRQRDAALRAGLQPRARVPDHRPARRGRRHSRASLVEARSMKVLFVRMAIVVMAAALAGGVGPARAQAPADCRVIEDFTNTKVGEFPTDWKVREDAGK